MPGLCIVMTRFGELPRKESARPLHQSLRNESAVDLMLQFEVCDLLTLPESFRPSEFQVAGALVELSMMGVLDRTGIVMPRFRELERAMEEAV